MQQRAILRAAVVFLLASMVLAGFATKTGAQLGLANPERSWAKLVTPLQGDFGFRVICCSGDGPPVPISRFYHQNLHIMVRLKDDVGQSVAFFPGERIRLRAESQTKVGEPGYCGVNPFANADADTDPSGYTGFSGSLSGGGTLYPGTGNLRVFIEIGGQEYPIQGTSPSGGESMSRIPFAFNSPDIQPNGIVDLVDVAIFSHDLEAVYDFRSDFYPDGVIDLADAGIFSSHIGHGCQ